MAAPTMGNNGLYDSVMSLDVDIADFVNFNVPTTINGNHYIKFKINRTIADQINLLKILMDTDKTMDFYLIPGMNAAQFEMSINYLMNPEKAKRQWKNNQLPDLVHASDYLGMNSMLKDSLPRLCSHVSKQSSRELNALFKLKIPHDNVLTYCVDPNGPSDWELHTLTLQHRTEFSTYCKLGHISLNEEYLTPFIENASPECLQFIKKKNLYFAFYRYIYDKLNIFAMSADFLRTMDVEVSLTLEEQFKPSMLFESLQKAPHLTTLHIWRLKQPLDLSKLPVMPKLRELKINVCSFSNMSEFLDHHFPELTHLDLSYNQLMNIGMISKHSMPKLEFLDLKGNQLDEVSELFSSNLPTLRGLYLMTNKLTTVPMIQSMENLEFLDLNYNQVHNVDGLFESHLPNLHSLNLANNRLTTVGMIKSMTNLQRLHLNYNQMNDISKLMASYLPELNTMDLRNNELESIPKCQFMHKLRSLNLNHNKLHDISEFLSSHLPSLSSVTLYSNRIQSLDIDSNLKKKLQGLEFQNHF